MTTCPACARPVAVARATCLYCGAPLPADLVARAEAARASVDGAAPLAAGLAFDRRALAAIPRDAPARSLVALDLARADPAALARALGLSSYEAGQRVRRVGWQLLRIGAAPDEREQAALAAAGARVEVLSEAGLRAAQQPLAVLGGTWEGARLHLRTTDGPARVAPEDVLIVVRGEITRKVRSEDGAHRRLAAVTPEPGWRLHVHRREDPRPLELDAHDFAFGAEGPAAGSARQTLARWSQDLARAAALDDGFRHVTPALAPAQPEARAGAAATAALRAPREAGRASPIEHLDNLAQFRFYSAWRAAVERRVASRG